MTESEQQHLMTLIEPSCPSCRHYEPLDPMLTKGKLMGFCTRYPPTVAIDSDGDPASAWPLVQETNVCGEFSGQH